MKSSFFYGGHQEGIADSIRDLLNSTPEFLSPQTSASTRATGDAIEQLISDQFDTLLGAWCREYSSNFSRRAMADLAFRDREDFYCIVDVKSHREDTRFNMPNLTSVERLSRFYEDDKNIFSVMMITYTLDGNRIGVTDVMFQPIEFLDWDCLTVGALGWGQIQIRDSSRITVNQGFSRKDWMLMLCDIMFGFYPQEILKIEERIDRFRNVRTMWAEKEDVWA